jgi:hypothetical protein
MSKARLVPAFGQGPTMKEVIHDPSHHRLLEAGDGSLILEVECGTTAVFLLTFVLNDDEQQEYRKRGAEYIKQLAWQVYDHPEPYLDRSK